MGDFDIQVFEESGRDNGTRYWLAHEFMTVLGYDTWTSFKSVITKAMGSCTRLGIDPTEAFTRIDVEVDGKPLKGTYKLTRFACFLVSMHADSKKPEVAKAKTLLAAIADQLIQDRINDHDLGRLETREDLRSAEKVMCHVAQHGGLESKEFGIFKDAGFRGMYNMSLRSLVVFKGGDPGKTLYDFMGLEELAGNLFRVTQTTARIKTQDIQGLNQLTKTAQQVGKEVRDIMIRNSGVAPERIAITEDIAGVKKRLKSTNRAMKKLDGRKPPKRIAKKKSK